MQLELWSERDVFLYNVQECQCDMLRLRSRNFEANLVPRPTPALCPAVLRLRNEGETWE